MKLTRTELENAEKELKLIARPLDKEFFNYIFFGTSSEKVVVELVKYLNSDGGFGKGMEPDVQLKASSPLATVVGLQYCEKISLPCDHEIFSKAIKYFINNFNEDKIFWPNVFENVNSEPHAVWWNVDRVESPPLDQWANPNAEIAGYLFKCRNLVPKKLLDLLTTKLVEVLESSDILQGSFYNLMCWERGLPYFPVDIQELIREKLERTYLSLSSLTQKDLKEIRIFMLTQSPLSIVNKTRPADVETLLDKEIRLFKKNGKCIPGWHWHQFEDSWEEAKKDWTGKLTVSFFHMLNSYRKIEL